jgi:hypothetical protein
MDEERPCREPSNACISKITVRSACGKRCSTRPKKVSSSLHQVEPGKSNKTLDVYAFYDPAVEQPWLLAAPVALKCECMRAISKDRWPGEQIRLSAKQREGADRQFVHNPESVLRLPELALLAGSILSFLAATFPAQPPVFGIVSPKERLVVFGGSSWVSYFRKMPIFRAASTKELGDSPFAQRMPGSPTKNQCRRLRCDAPSQVLGSICKVL